MMQEETSTSLSTRGSWTFPRMGALQIDRHRKALQAFIEADGRFDATELARRIGRSPGYIRDYLGDKKRRLGGAEEIGLIEKLYGLAPGTLLSVEALEELTKSIENKPRKPQLVGHFDPDENDPEDHEPRMVEGMMGRDVGPLPKDAILQAEVAIGMGPGGITHVTDLMNPDGNSYSAEGVKDWWRLPADVVRGRFRVPAHRIRCFEAMGDSMEPKVHDGDIVFVDIGHRVPSPPGIYALADALGGVILKRLSISAARGQDPVIVDLISDNPKIPPERRTLDEITITGRYLGRLTTE